MKSEVNVYQGSEKVQILLDFGFRPFDIDTIALYESYRKGMNGPTGSYMRIANILCWGFYSVPYYREMDGFFLIVNDDAYYGSFTVHAPVGNYEKIQELSAVLAFLREVCDALGEDLELLQGKEWMRPFLEQISDYAFDWQYDPGESDYLYQLSLLEKSVENRKVHYAHKVQHFLTSYHPEVTMYSAADYESCMRIIEQMYCDKEGCSACVFGCMKKFYDRVIAFMDVIRGAFYVVKSAGRVIAFFVLVEDEDLLYFDRKTIPNLYGFSEYLNQFILEQYQSRYEVMNFEEDMGREGLRRHKKALGPYVLSHNYCVKVRDL